MGGRRADGDGRGSAVDGDVGGVENGDGLAAIAVQGRAERAGAAGERGACRQHGTLIAAGEAQRGRIIGGVVEWVLCGDGDGQRRALRDAAGSADYKVVRGRGTDGDAAAGAIEELLAVSVAVMVCVPAVVRTALKTPTPVVSVALGGSSALPCCW